METSPESGSKKVLLEELSKEELITKCKTFLVLAQKAKQTKDSLIEENNKLKDKLSKTSDSNTELIIKTLTQQKLDLLTSLEEIKSQKTFLDNKFITCESQLREAEKKIIDLDTSNQGYKRQINRLTDENEQLIYQLDGLEKQIEELKKIGLQQKEQLLVLEKNNIILSKSTDEVNKTAHDNHELKAELERLKNENFALNEKITQYENLANEKDKNIHVIGEELIAKNDIIQNLEGKLECVNEKVAKEKNELKQLENKLKKNEEELFACKTEIVNKTSEMEKHINLVDDLNTKLHKYKALCEKLQQDVQNSNSKLASNQIISSGVASDLENANEKLKEKLKNYHSKIVRFARDVKRLKDSKGELLTTFKIYTSQVNEWKGNLKVLAKRIEESGKEYENINQQKEFYFNSFQEVTDENKKLNDKLSDYTLLKSQFDEVTALYDDSLKIIKNVNVEKERREEENESLNKKLQDLLKEKDELLKEIDMNKEKSRKEEINLTERYSCKNEELEKIIIELTEEKIVLENDKLAVLEENKKIKDEINLLKLSQEEHLKLKEDLQSDLLRENEIISTKVNELNGVIATRDAEIIKLRQLNVNLSEDLQGNQKQIEDTSKKIKDYENAIEQLENLNGNLQTTISKSRSDERQLAEISSEEIIKQVKKNERLSEIIQSLEVKINEIQRKPSDCKSVQTENDYDEKINALKRENSELLSEMNEMNQALKERGETISKQQSYCEEILKKIQMYETQLNANADSLNKKEEIIDNLQKEINEMRDKDKGEDIEEISRRDEEISRKDETIRELRKDVQELREKANQLDASQDLSYAESESMSTSTISRSEEASRMKDIEGSWEERYGKLRSLAVKLKAKVRELTNDVAREQAEKAELQQKLTRSVQSYQKEIDKLQDELDSSRNECKAYLKKLDTVAADVSRDKKRLADDEDVIAKLKSEVDNLNKEKANTENWKKQVGAKVQTLKKELEANAVLKKEFEAQITKLNAELDAKEKQLRAETEKHNQTKSTLLESTNECKKQSLLNLEIQDYERSVRELSQKVERKQEIVNKLKSQLDSQKSNVDGLKDQVKNAEANVKLLEEQIEIANKDNALHKKKINDLQVLLTEKETKIQDLTYSIENIRSDNEDLSTQLSKTIAESEKLVANVKKESEILKGKNMGLEDSLRAVTRNLRAKEQELNEVQGEYEGYKVRAQSVLRQNQSRDVCVEEKLNEECASLRSRVASRDDEIARLKEDVKRLGEENVNVLSESRAAQRKVEVLETSLECARDEMDKLTVKHQQIISEHTEAVRGLKLHAETLSQCYRQQLTDQETKHNRELAELQSKLDRGPSPSDYPPPAAIPSTPREEGEGSESVDGAANNGAHPVPLEKLLSDETEQEVSFVKKQLAENESKVAHLTALLADTEQDLAKHAQMNKVLKEEIRRQQRSVEREKHAENLEYLKNVVLKFLTLGHGDERERLVPVLNTILKLSPEESQKLNSVARGDKGWSNYIPLWGKPQ